MLREAASRLQQKIQKHLLDSEDGKMLDDLAAEKVHNLDRTRDKMFSMEYQVKPLLENTLEIFGQLSLQVFVIFIACYL